VDGVFEVRHRHAEQLQDPSRFLARHLFAPSMLAQSRRSSGTSRQRGSPSGLKFLVVTKCIPWWRFSLNFPPPYRAAIHPAGSSRNGAISVAETRTTHLNRIVPANGSWTPSVAVNPGQTRANSSRVWRPDGPSTPRFIRFRLSYGWISSNDHGGITTDGVHHKPVKNLEIRGLGPKTARLLYDRLGVDSVSRLEALARSGEILRVPGIREKTRENILKSIALWQAGRARTPLARAREIAARVAEALAAH